MATLIATAPDAVATRALGKRYGSSWALRDCTVRVPAGRVSALVGPNGSGTSTLLHLLAGLSIPSTGEALIFGQAPAQTTAFLARIGFLAQEVPLYRRFSAADHIAMGAHLNHCWDSKTARTHLRAVGIPLERHVGTLSGGQRAQVALALALAKCPRLLLLDEPVAALDPLARRDFLTVLAEAASERALTIVLSSHLVTDLEQVCDHLLLLSASRPQLCGDIPDILASHKVLTGPRSGAAAIERTHAIVAASHALERTTLLVRAQGPIDDLAWEVRDVALEEVILAYMGNVAGSAVTELGRGGMR